MALMCPWLHPPLLSVVDLMITELIKGLTRHFTFTCSILYLFTLLLMHKICWQQSATMQEFGYFPGFFFFFLLLQVDVKVTPLTPANKQNCAFIIFAWSPATYLWSEPGYIHTLPEFLNSPDHQPSDPSVIDINDRLHSWGACVIPSVFTNRLKYDPLTVCSRARRYPCHGSLRTIITSTPCLKLSYRRLWLINPLSHL